MSLAAAEAAYSAALKAADLAAKAVTDPADFDAAMTAKADAYAAAGLVFVTSAVVDPAGGPPPLTAPAGGGAVTGTGKLT